MTIAKPSNDSEYIDPCVAEFLARHGIDREEGMDVLDTIVQTNQSVGSGTSQTIVARLQPEKPESQLPKSKTKTKPARIVQSTQPVRAKSAEPVLPDTQPPIAPKHHESADTMRELRSVANAISVSISRSNLLREKLKEASRFLALGFISGLLALILAYITTSVRSVVFFAALFTLVLGLISTYRSTMIMTKLGRIARI